MNRILAVLFTLALVIVGSGQADDMTRFREVNRLLAAANLESDWAKVEGLCLELEQLSSRIFGAKSPEVARAQIALGDVQWQLAKFDEALRNFESAKRMLEENAAVDPRDLIRAYAALAYGHHYRNKPETAKALYRKALDVADRGFGRTSVESYGPALNLANIYLMERKYAEANQYYLRSYESALTHFKIDSTQVRAVEKARLCADLEGSFSKEQRADFNNVRKKFATSAGDDSDILNGKAVKLPKPKYPPAAAASRVSGRVAVEVLIDENGDVIQAHPVCSYNRHLASAAVEAARNAKFSPTLASGTPRRATGIITYNFVP